MKNPFPYSDNHKRYYTYAYALKQRFGERVARVSLNGGFTCPNIDGSHGIGGCTYCASGSGEFAGDPALSILEQFSQGVRKIEKKWHAQKYIAYFQAHTNTYASVEVLEQLYYQAMDCPGVVGLAISTRPDCLPLDVCHLLETLSHKTYLVIELGLQTVHDSTAQKINRCHTYQEFLDGYEKLRSRGIFVGVHLIDFLPGETAKMMKETVKAVGELHPHLVKLHLLNLLHGTKLAAEYAVSPWKLPTMMEYIQVVCDQIELLPKDVIVGRVTGDAAKEELMGPIWSLQKRKILNGIDQELARRDSWQGKALS